MKVSVFVFLMVFSISLQAAGLTLTSVTDTDSTEHSKRNFHYNILGGPAYTPDFGVVLGMSALGTFKINPHDTIQKRSVVPLNVGVLLSGGVNVVVKPQLFFKNDKFRIFGRFACTNTTEHFYGVGYSTNKDYLRSDSTSENDHFAVQVNPWFLFRIGGSNFFAGPQIDLSYDRIKNPARHLVTQRDYAAHGGNADGYSSLVSGVGFLATYDSRDIPANAYSGLYLDIRGIVYNKVIGSDNNFSRLEIDYRQYKTVGKRKVLAWNVLSKNVFGDVPLTQYAMPGTPFDLRGYYRGQYRDKSAHIVMGEYRSMLNTDGSTKIKRLLSRLGFVAWGGVGFVGPGICKIEGVLPNAGLGLRIEIQPRMNVRLDLGRNFKNGDNLFYFNMTEAF